MKNDEIQWSSWDPRGRRRKKKKKKKKKKEKKKKKKEKKKKKKKKKKNRKKKKKNNQKKKNKKVKKKKRRRKWEEDDEEEEGSIHVEKGMGKETNLTLNIMKTVPNDTPDNYPPLYHCTKTKKNSITTYNSNSRHHKKIHRWQIPDITKRYKVDKYQISQKDT